MLFREANPNDSDYLASHASQGSSSLESADLGIRVLFHQSHFDCAQQSLPFCHREPPGSANPPSHLSRQIYFTNRTLTARNNLFPSASASQIGRASCRERV